MDKEKVTYRLVDGAVDDRSALLVASDGGVGSTTEMDVVQARNGLPKIIQKDRLVFDRQEEAFYVGNGDGSPKRVADIRIVDRMHDLPLKGTGSRLYICLRENAMAVWTENGWKMFSTSPVSVTSYNGVSVYDAREDFPAEGQEGQIYLTKDGYGYSYQKGKGYQGIFGGYNLSYTRAESDARYAQKKDIVAQKTLEELGGITARDVDLKVQAAMDEAEEKFAQSGAYDEQISAKADKADVYTKTESDEIFAKKESIPTLSSLGAITAEQAEAIYATKKTVDGISADLASVKAKTNTLSSYAKTEDVKKLVKDSIDEANPELSIYALKDDVNSALDKKADALTTATKTELESYALKSELPTAASIGALTKSDAELTYAKIEDVAAARKESMSLTDKLEREHYTKDDIDQKFAIEEKTNAATYITGDTIVDYLKKDDAENKYAHKSELEFKADKADSYTKDEVDQKIKYVEDHGVDLTGYLKQSDETSDNYIIDQIHKNADLTAYTQTKDLLTEVIKQDKAKTKGDLVLSYFVNQDDIKELAKDVVENGTLHTNDDGSQTISFNGRLKVASDGHAPINLYINGVRCTEGEDYEYDAVMNQLKWSKANYKLDTTDKIRLEYGTAVNGYEAPSEKDSSTNETAKLIAINNEDLALIRSCATRAEQAQKSSEAARDIIAETAKQADASAKESALEAEIAKNSADAVEAVAVRVEKQRTEINEEIKNLQEMAVVKDAGFVLKASSWKGGEYVLKSDRIKSDSIIFFDVRNDASENEKNAFADAVIDCTTQADGAVILEAEFVPLIDIPVKLSII